MAAQRQSSSFIDHYDSDDDEDEEEVLQDMFSNMDRDQLDMMEESNFETSLQTSNRSLTQRNASYAPKPTLSDNPLMTSRPGCLILDELTPARLYLEATGCYPLRVGQDNWSKGTPWTEVDFSGHELLTDVIIIDLFTNCGSVLGGLRKVNLAGCVHLTDVSVVVMAAFISNNSELTTIILDGCYKITERGLLALASCHARSITVSAKATGVSFIPKALEYHRFTITNCPMLQVKYMTDTSETRMMECGQVVIAPTLKCLPEFSLLHFLRDGTSKPLSSHFAWHKGWLQDKIDFSLLEISPAHPCARTLLPRSFTQVLLPFNSKTETSLVAKSLASSIIHFIQEEVFAGDPKTRLPNGKWSPHLVLGQNCNLFSGTVECCYPFPDNVPVPQVMMKQYFSPLHAVFELEVMKGVLGQASIDIGIVNTASQDDKAFQKHKITAGEGDHLRVVLDLSEETAESTYSVPGCFNVFHNGKKVGTLNSTNASACSPAFTMYDPKSVVRYLDNQPIQQNPSQQQFIATNQINVGSILDQDTGIITYSLSSKKDPPPVMSFRGLQPISSTNNWFAFTIKNEGRKRCLSIGLVHEVCQTRRQPGWDEGTIGWHADDGVLFCKPKADIIQSVPDSEAKCYTGDVMKLEVEFSQGEEYITDKKTYTINFYKNDKQVKKVRWTFNAPEDARGSLTPPCRVVPAVGLHSPGEQLQLHNFLQTWNNAQLLTEYNIKKESPHFLILGSLRGTISKQELNLYKTRTKIGYYQSYNSLTADHPYYEVRMKDDVTSANAGMGIACGAYSMDDMVGLEGGSIGLHFLDKMLYSGAAQGKKTILESVKSGDVIGFGFIPDGVDFHPVSRIPKCNQKLKFYVTHNGKKVVTHEQLYVGGGLHPTITSKHPNFCIELLNHFDPLVNSTRSTNMKENAKFGAGVNFLAVSMGQDKVPDNLPTLVVDQLNSINTKLAAVDNASADNTTDSGELESPVHGSFLIHHQQGMLQKTLMSLAGFLKNFPVRFAVTSVDVNSVQDQDKVIKKLVANQRAAMETKYYLYEFLPRYATVFDKLLQLKDKKLITLPDFQDLCREYDIESGIQGSYTGACQRLLSLAHDWGKVIYLEDCEPPLVITDVDCFLDMVYTIYSGPVDFSGEEVRCVVPQTRVWRDRSVLKLAMDKFDNIPKAKIQLMLRYLTKSGQLLQLGTIRGCPEDSKFFLLCPTALSLPPSDTEKYFTKNENQFRIVETYSFPVGFSEEAFVGCAAFVAHFTKPTMMWRNGLVWHTGGVEMVLARKTADEGEEKVLLQATCFLPVNPQDDSSMQESTRYVVKRNVWSQLGIFSDVLQYHLLHQGAVFHVLTDEEPLIERYSICGSHQWSRPEDTTDASRHVSVCTLCNNCGDKGWSCDYNGIIGPDHRQCLCHAVDVCCWHCGICKSCARNLWRIKSWVRPGRFMSPDVHMGEKNLSSRFPTLDAVTSNTLELTVLSRTLPDILLLSETSDKGLLVFPGMPVVAEDALSITRTPVSNHEHGLEEGDKLKISIKIPQEDVVHAPPGEFYFNICQNISFQPNNGQLQYMKSTSRRNFIEAAVVISQTAMHADQLFEIDILALGQGTLRFGVVKGWPGQSISSTFVSSSTTTLFYDGQLSMSCMGKNSPVSATIGTGSTVGCGLRYKDSDELEIFFTVDGKEVCQSELNQPKGHAMVSLSGSDTLLKLLPSSVWCSPYDKLKGSVGETEDDKCLDKAGLKIFPKNHLEFVNPFDTDDIGMDVLAMTEQEPLFSKSSLRKGKKKTPLKKSYSEQRNIEETMTIVNTQATPIMFKVRVTNPARYTVQPNKGFLMDKVPQILKIRMRLDEHENIDRDKLQIQWVSVDTISVSMDGFDDFFRKNSSRVVDARLTLGWKQGKEDLPLGPPVIPPEAIPDVRAGPPSQESYCMEVVKNGVTVSQLFIPRLCYTVAVFDREVMKARLGSKDVSRPSHNLVISSPKANSSEVVTVFIPGMMITCPLPSAQLELVKKQEWCWASIDTCSVVALVQCVKARTLQVSILLHDNQKTAYMSIFDVAFSDVSMCLGVPPSFRQGKSQKLEFEDEKKKITIANAYINDVAMFVNYEYKTSEVATALLHKISGTSGLRSVVEVIQNEGEVKPGLGTLDLPHGRSCLNMPYLTSVRETELTKMCHTLREWDHVSHAGDLTNIGMFLPGKTLRSSTLLYPSLAELFNLEALTWHPLCKCFEKVASASYQKVTHPIHMVDSEGNRDGRIVDLIPSFSSNLLICCAVAELATTKMRMPSYQNIVSMDKDMNLERAWVEAGLAHMVNIYSGVCQLTAWLHGSFSDLPYTEHPDPPASDDLKVLTASSLIDGCCKAHASQFLQNEKHESAVFDMSVFEPYGDLVTILKRNIEGIKEIPDDFPAKLPNLEVIVLEGTTLLEKLPASMSSMSNLKTLQLKDSTKLQCLPGDVGDCPQLQHIAVQQSQLRELPESITRSKTLEILAVQSNLLTKLPLGIGRVTTLKSLNLSNNPILQLPRDFGQLKSLEILNFSGVPWVTPSHSQRNILSVSASGNKDGYQGEEVIRNALILTPQVYTDLVEEVAGDRREVDNSKLAEINAKLHFAVPRLCLDEDDSDETASALAPIFGLKNLEVLELDYQAMFSIPSSIKNLKNLRSLSLNHCMHLHSLPGALGELPKIKTVSLKSCPSLRTPPEEIVSRGTESVLAYLKWLGGGFTENWRTKLMLVGLGGAGKTSLLRALMDNQHRTKHLTGEDITDGIDIKTWSVKYTKEEKDLEITYSAWDFAGQTVYYNTHQFFLSNRAVYLLLWTTRLGYEHSGLEFWLSSIKCHAPNAPIFVIGTHCDQVAKAELPKRDLLKHYPQICGFHFVSSITGQGIYELQSAIVEATAQENYMGELVSKVYLDLEEKIVDQRKKTSVLEWSQVRKFGLEVGICDEKDLRQAVQFLHDLGTVQYFDNDFLRDHIVINPQWIVDVMACVVSVKDSPIMDGRFKHSDITTIWKDQSEELHEWLLRLTEEFDLTFPLPQEPINLVPCLLPQNEPKYEWDTPGDNHEERQTLMIYRFEYLPAGLFNRMQVRLFQFADTEVIWKRGSLLKKNGHAALILQPNDKELSVKVQGLRPENILFLVHEVLEGLIAESFKGVDYDYLIPCLDCLARKDCDGPCMFEGELIREAFAWNAPFLQCRKYFHAISMPMLQAAMPPDDNKEFDIHLQNSVRNLVDLRSELTTDVFFYFCGADIPDDGDKQRVHPRTIYNDLTEEGYKCWYQEDLNQVSIQDTFMALQDSKLLLVLMSNDFEKDDRCRKLFLYAKDELRKPFQVVAVGSSLDWQQTHMGCSIGGNSVVFVNMRQKSRYSNKIVELKEKVILKLSRYSETKEHPKCFLSYAWANSHDAVKTGSRKIEGALGWVDPRDVKAYLQENGIPCWLDTEQAGKEGLFQDISVGIKKADFMVACVSKEYAESTNCMMELRFAVCTLNKPIIMAVVGTGNKWMSSEIGMLRDRCDCEKVDLQEENEFSYRKLLRLSHETLEKVALEKQNKLEERNSVTVKKPKSQDKAAINKDLEAELKSQFLHEELELAQRQFLRHTATMAEKTASQIYPRLFVLDFVPQTKETVPRAPRPKSSLTSRTSQDGSVLETTQRPSLQRRESQQRVSQLHMAPVDFTEEWVDESLCMRVLCEHEQGWHFVEDEYIHLPQGMMNGEKEEIVKLAAPFLGRLYVMLESSGFHLNFLGMPAGQSLKQFIMEKMADGTSDFSTAYSLLREKMVLWDTQLSYGKLDRCHLPTGQIRWLCAEHQKANRITVLGSNTTVSISRQPLVTDDDYLMKSFMGKYAHLSDKWKLQIQAEKAVTETLPSTSDSNSGGDPKRGRISRKTSKLAISGQSSESMKKLKAASETVKAASNWPKQPTSRACVIL